MHKIKKIEMIDNIYIVLFISAISAVFAYNLLIINGYVNPDGIIEGVAYYNNSMVASSMSGRWLVRYLIKCFGNIVNPFVDVMFYAFCVGISSLIAKKIWKGMSDISLYLISSILIVSPSVISQLSYLYMSPSYAVCCLLGFSYVYYAFNEKKYSVFLASISITLMLGLYQSYIGMAASLACMTIIIKAMDNSSKFLNNKIVKLLCSAVLGVALYFVILKIDNTIYGVIDTGRMSNISLSKIIASFYTSVAEAYKYYFDYYLDYVFHRDLIYVILFAILSIGLVKKSLTLIKKKKYYNFAIIVIMVALIPLLNNISYLAYPENPITLVMEFQNILIVPFVLTIVDMIDCKKMSALSKVLVIYLCWTYIMCANATFKCYELSYNALNKKYSMLLNDILHIEEYKENETTVIIYGFFDDEELRKEINIYRYAIDFPDNVAFWIDNNGVNYGRRNYVLNYFGIDFNLIDNGWIYDYYLYEGDIKEMPVWPKQGSIIYTEEDYLIVKISNNPIDCYWD